LQGDASRIHSEVNQHQPTHLITGANTGIGAATALALAARGAHVILACRSRARAAPVLERLGRQAQYLQLDLASLRSVERAAIELRGVQLDSVINNAGVGGARGLSADGFEIAFAVNCLGHYALTRALLPQLRDSARIVHLGSGSHRNVSALDWMALQRPTQSLTGIREYAVSKLAVLCIHRALSQRFTQTRPNLMSLVADPGDVASEAWRHLPQPFRALFTCRMKSPNEGAHTPLHCITSPHLSNGGCYVDAQLERVSEAAMNSELAEEAWAQCARWTGFSP
jgi:NAD(P)-dependent dehydrogenase (short-subunit alcohol dehydrogenase family)